MDKPTRLNLMIAFAGVLLAMLSLGWQVFDKLYSSSEQLKPTITVTPTGSMMVEIVNVGAVNAYVEVPYLHLSTENGKGYGFYFNDNNEAARLLAPGDKATFICRALEDWQVTGFIAPQRVRIATVTVSSAKGFVRIFNLASPTWKDRLHSLYSLSAERYDDIEAAHVYEQVDFRSQRINGATHFKGEFYIAPDVAQQVAPSDAEKPRR